VLVSTLVGVLRICQGEEEVVAEGGDDDGDRRGRGQARVRARERAQAQNKTRDSEKMIAAQQARKSLRSRRSHGKRGGMRLRLPSVFSDNPLDKIKGGVFVLQRLLYVQSK